jgi:putative glutamine amidotransferase
MKTARGHNTSPVIGILPGFAHPSEQREFCKTTSVLYCDLNYAKRIEAAGGIPLLLTHVASDDAIQQYNDLFDGLLFTGGEDVDPTLYGQDWIATETKVAAERDEFEFKVFSTFFATLKPIMAICRGFQVVNVALGGTLIQDIPTQQGFTHHVQSLPTDFTTHSVTLEEQSLAARALGCTELAVNSHHHQALDRIADNLRITGRSEEGIPEAFEHKQYPYLLGVQWHPERLSSQQELQQRLFDHFVNACKHGIEL